MKNLRIPLLNDCFNYLEANDVVLELIDKKINFYKLKNLQHQVRYEMPDHSAQRKISELQDARRELHKLIEEARQRQTEFRVDASLRVEPLNSGHSLASGTFG